MLKDLSKSTYKQANGELEQNLFSKIKSIMNSYTITYLKKHLLPHNNWNLAYFCLI